MSIYTEGYYKMNDETKKTSGCTIRLSTLLTGIFVILKLTGTISWSWFWVLSPTIFSVGATVAIIGLLASIAGIAALVSNSKFKKEINGHKRRNLGRSNAQEYDFNRSFVDEVSRDETFKAARDAAKTYDHLSRRVKINMLKEELNRVEGNRPQNIIYIDDEDSKKEEKPYTHSFRK